VWSMTAPHQIPQLVVTVFQIRPLLLVTTGVTFKKDRLIYAVWLNTNAEWLNGWRAGLLSYHRSGFDDVAT
jgi:hypothetical protein